MFDALIDNQIFTAGAGVVGLGAGMAVLRQGAKQIAYLTRRHFLTTLEIPSHDKSYFWVLHWITQQAAKRTQHLSISTSFVQHDNGSFTTQFRFVPGPGRHFFFWRKTLFQVERQREKAAMDVTTAAPRESVTLTAWSRDKSVLTSMLNEAKSLALSEQEGKTVVYTSWGQEWRTFGYPRRRRPLNSVILDQGVSERIVSDVCDFMRNGKWYIDRGIPYRRGYLLHGPPGSGKSSFIQALAGDLDYNICVMNLAEKYLSDDRLSMLLSIVPQRSIILLEDIDAAFNARREKTSEGHGLSFSGFLNALDGVVSSEGRIIFMTTNHIERLDPALMRPGRVDVREFIGDASPFQIRQMFLRFYETETSLADQFVAALEGAAVSTAQLQGHFLFYKEDAQKALDNVQSLRQK